MKQADTSLKQLERIIQDCVKQEKVSSFTDTGRKFAEELISQLFRYEEEAAAMINGDEMEAATEVQNRFADILLEKVGQEDE